MDERRLRGQTAFRFRDSVKSNASQSEVYTSVNIYIYHVTLTKSRFLFVTKKRKNRLVKLTRMFKARAICYLW